MQDRVSSKNRFGVKASLEVEHFLKQQKELRLQYPERVERAREEEAKARFKIEELHKNYFALQASNEAGKAPVKKEKKAPAQLSRSEYYSFTKTGVYRP